MARTLLIKLPRGIRRESAALLTKSLASLTLAIEHFNRPSDLGRSESVLILLDHSLEMLLKAAILHKGEKIRRKGDPNTLGFKSCVNKAHSSQTCKFLSESDVLTLRSINGLRDAAQHHLLTISEELLYLHVQSGITLGRDVVERVFGIHLASVLPRRVLPVSTVALTSIEALFDQTMTEVRKLLAPGTRRKQDALDLLRPLEIMDRAIRNEEGLPTDRELAKYIDRIKRGDDWPTIFLGVNLVEFQTEGNGTAISFHLTKKQGLPIRIVDSSEDDLVGVAPIVVKHTNELDHYSLTPTNMAKKLGISPNKFVALRRHLGLCDRPDFYKEFTLGKQVHKRYSQAALRFAESQLKHITDSDWLEIWTKHAPGKGKG